MKKIGIIGGMGPEATIEYYSEIINAFKNEAGDLNYPEIIIYSVNLSEFIALMKEKKYAEVVASLSGKIEGLKQCGAEFAALSANTPHLVFDQLKEQSGIPMISIVETTCYECMTKGYRRPGLIGTRFTMEASFYQDVFKKHGLDVIIPYKEEMEIVNYKLFSEIELGIFKEDTRNVLIGIIEKMVKEQHIDSLILGCTEFPLILIEPVYAGIPMLNTTRIHVDAIVKYCAG
jgi:aspartate racemase